MPAEQDVVMTDAYANETMRELLDRLKIKLGADWAQRLADEMIAEEREALTEALKNISST